MSGQVVFLSSDEKLALKEEKGEGFWGRRKKEKETEIRKLGFMAPLQNHQGVNERGNAVLIAMDSHNCYD